MKTSILTSLAFFTSIFALSQNYTVELVKDINPGSGNSSQFLAYKTVYNDKLYFSADDGTHGLELWVSDGTTEGTQLLKDIFPGSQNGVPREFGEFNGKLFFVVDDGVHSAEPWYTDGTAEGTYMLKDIHVV